MDMITPPLRIKIVLESNPLKSIMLVGESGVYVFVYVRRRTRASKQTRSHVVCVCLFMHPCIHMCTCVHVYMCTCACVYVIPGGGAEVRRGLFYIFLKHDTGHWQGEQTFETQPWRHSQLDNCSPYPTYDPNHV